jgi:cytochrome c oxidase subunit 2
MPLTEPASSFSGRVDDVFLYIFVLSAIFLIGITATIVYFVVRYSRKRHPRPVNVVENTALEVTWTVIPTVLFLSMFVYGWTNFEYMRQVPRDAMVIDVTARQWSWSFRYPNGKVTPDLYLALDRPVKVLLHSADVIHGFYIPEFRVKEDVVPGKTNFAWFQPELLGSFDLECTVICGPGHAHMLAKVNVVSEKDFKQWYFGPADAPLPKPPQPGMAAPAPPSAAVTSGPPAALALLESHGCLGCHSLDGSPSVGPTFKGRFGTRALLEVGGAVREEILDDSYYRRAIQDPGAEIVKGYPPVMPTLHLSEAEVNQIVEYLRTLG